MQIDMQPTPDSYSIFLPVTFDYRGGRSQNVKNTVIATLIVVAITILLVVLFCINANMELWRKIVSIIIVSLVSSFILRFVIFDEWYYSDMFENLLLTDYEIDTTNVWQIFDIDTTQPYTAYFRNGYKGIFIRMERGPISGKANTAMYQHYELIANAYNKAHSLNMNIRHIDYMANVGDDERLDAMYDDLDNVSNPDMQEMLIDIYDNLKEEMSRNYTSYDVYLFLSRGRTSDFIYNTQRCVNAMIGGNFITYSALNRDEITKICKDLFNLKTFSSLEASARAMGETTDRVVVPISITHYDGTVEKLNKTKQEKREALEEAQRKQKEKRKNKKSKNNLGVMNEDIDLF